MLKPDNRQGITPETGASPRQSLAWLLVGTGWESRPIPPRGHGAVESIIWDYKTHLEKLGHRVVVVNTNDRRKMIDTINRHRPDIVHVHHHDFADVLGKIRAPVKIFTVHTGEVINKPDISRFLCKHLVQYLKDGPFAFVLSPVWRKVFLNFGYNPAEVFVTLNGADHRRFRFRKTPLHENHSIYLGQITVNKRQSLYQAIDSIDFVGPWGDDGGDERFDKTRRNYLGEWTRDTLYGHLSDYANLVILSEYEVAAPLVVLEALVCGLGVVVSTRASANLDTQLPWISVIPDDKITDVAFVESEIARNREISLRHREQIREYGVENFSWEKLVPRYADLCLKLHTEKTARQDFPARSANTLRRLRYLLPVLPSLFLHLTRYMIFKSLPYRIRHFFS